MVRKHFYSHRGYVYSPMYKMTDDDVIHHVHNIYKRSEPNNVVFVYWGLLHRPLNEEEFKGYVDQMIKVTESRY